MFDNVKNALTFVTLVVKFICATNRKSVVTRSDWEAARSLAIRLDQVIADNSDLRLTPYQKYVLDHGCACILARVEAATGKFDISPATEAKWAAVERAGARSARGTRRRLSTPMVKF